MAFRDRTPIVYQHPRSNAKLLLKMKKISCGLAPIKRGFTGCNCHALSELSSPQSAFHPRRSGAKTMTSGSTTVIPFPDPRVMEKPHPDTKVIRPTRLGGLLNSYHSEDKAAT